MAVPRQKRTKSHRNQRRMHIFIKNPPVSICPKCGADVLLHTVCLHCGFYKGREIIDVMAKLAKKEKKQREKEILAKGKEQKAKPLNAQELSKK